MAIDIQAGLDRQTFAVGEAIPLALTVANSGPEVVRVVDPRQAGDHLRFRVRIGEGTRLVTMTQATAQPGVPLIVSDVQVPIGRPWVFHFDLAQLLGTLEPGGYTVTVEYDWQPEHTWRSRPISYEVTRSEEGSLIVTPSEALRAGYHGLLWLQPEGNEARAFLLDFRIQEPKPAIAGAMEVARVPTSSRFTLSMGPAGAPFPDRWVIWQSADQVSYCWWARSVPERLPARSVSFQGSDPELILPALADAPPQNGRPGCLIGVLLRYPGASELAPVALDSNGQARYLRRETIHGDVRAAWATSPGADLRLFVFAVQRGPALHILAVSHYRGGIQPPDTWFTMDAEFLAGDVRPAGDGALMVGLLVKKGAAWERLAFTAGPGLSPEPKAAPLDGGRDAAPVGVRLNFTGAVHTLFVREQMLRYAPPAAAEETWSGPRPVTGGNSADLFITPQNRAVLVYYDFEKGPVFQEV